jgi:hypothetical protein
MKKQGRNKSYCSFRKVHVLKSDISRHNGKGCLTDKKRSQKIVIIKQKNKNSLAGSLRNTLKVEVRNCILSHHGRK